MINKKETAVKWQPSIHQPLLLSPPGLSLFFPPDLCYSAANKAVQQVCQLRFSASCPTQAAGKSARILISVSLAALKGRWRAFLFSPFLK